MDITQDQINQLLPNNNHKVEWFNALTSQLPKYDITTLQQVAAFIGQTLHESGEYTATIENLDYSADALSRVWPSRFPMSVAVSYARKPVAIANRAYANRMGNGDEDSGDGNAYKGRGLIMTTGKANYQRFADDCGMDLADVPAYLETCDGAVASACFFWKSNDCNSVCGDIEALTKKINGGILGLADRTEQTNRALSILGASDGTN